MSSQAEGTFRTVAGKAEYATSGVPSDSTAEMRGKMRELAGRTQGAAGEALNTVRSIVTDQPGIALLLAAGFGLAVGWLVARR